MDRFAVAGDSLATMSCSSLHKMLPVLTTVTSFNSENRKKLFASSFCEHEGEGTRSFFNGKPPHYCGIASVRIVVSFPDSTPTM